jgi:uncharacterized coiled-coil DUF342 family protein
MDEGTMRDYIQDLMLQRDALNAQVRDLEEQIRLLEAERDQWQRQAMSNG